MWHYHYLRPETDLQQLLKRYWGYDSFRPRQEDVIRDLIAGRDVAAVMPTGGGKSLCYQMAALVLGKTAVVISPLIALMQDQVAQLEEIGVSAALLNSTLEPPEQRRIISQARKGKYQLLYLSPERLVQEGTMDWLASVPISFFAIDEAHCISEWGHEFRPEYRQLGVLRERFPGRPVAAFTASATQRVRHDIVHQLRLNNPGKYALSFHRPNLRFRVKCCDAPAQTRLLLAALEAHAGENVIIYAPTIARVGDTVDLLKRHGIESIPYHGQMETSERRTNQERWMSDEVPVLVGTIAFGTRHQQAGRAGGDSPLPAEVGRAVLPGSGPRRP